MSDRSVDTFIPPEGVKGHKREIVVFLAGVMDNPNALIKRALEFDKDLAYDMIREANNEVDRKLIHQVGKKFWNEIFKSDISGYQRAIALKFKALAAKLGQTDEELAREIENPSDETSFYSNLLAYYQELNDTSSQQKILDNLKIEVDDIPQNIIFQKASLASDQRDYDRAIELYTKYIEHHPKSSGAYNNRAIAYNNLGKQQEALADYKKAIELDPNDTVYLTNLARLLLDMGQQEEAIEQLQTAIHYEFKYPEAFYQLGSIFASEKPEEALPLLEQALRFAPPQYITKYTKQIAEVQEKTSDFIGAIRSLKRLIELNPTDSSVTGWKRKIAEIRLKFEDLEKRLSVQERLQKDSEVNLFDLAQFFFKTLEYDCQYTSSLSLVATTNKQELPSQLNVYILDVPTLTGTSIREAIESFPNPNNSNQNIIIFSPAETLEADARTQLFAYQQSGVKINLITSLDAEAAILKGTCFQILQNIIRRSNKGEDSFKYTNIVRNRIDFFGRNEEIRDLIWLIEDNQLFALYGIHKIGKSSLLRRVEQNLNANYRDITIVWVEMEQRMKNSSNLYYNILQKIPYNIELPRDENSISTNDFDRILRQFQAYKQKQRPGHRILLIIDEYNYLIPNRSGKGGIENYLEVLGLFKSLYQQENWFGFLPCGRTTALSRVGNWDERENPFIGMLEEKFLEPFTFEEVREMMKSLGAKHALEFSPEALKEIFKMTGGHPLFTRILGSHIQRNSRESKLVEPELVKIATESYLNSRGDKSLLLAIYEERLDEKEQYIVELLAVSNQPVSRKKLMSKTSSSEDRRFLRDAIDNLIDTTVLQEKRGEISHRYEILRRVIDEEIPEDLRQRLILELTMMRS